MLLRYTQESAQPFIYKGYALFVSKLEILHSYYVKNSRYCQSPIHIFYPKATSNTIITENPTAKNMVPISECSPSDISGISSSTTT